MVVDGLGVCALLSPRWSLQITLKAKLQAINLLNNSKKGAIGDG